MKYLVRALKYFVYLFIILALLIAVLVLTKVVDGNLSTMFVNGTDSLWQIALVMAVFALIYPRFGYSTLPLHMGGSTEEIAPVVKKAMDARGYVPSKEDADGNMVFIKRSPLRPQQGTAALPQCHQRPDPSDAWAMTCSAPASRAA